MEENGPSDGIKYIIYYHALLIKYNIILCEYSLDTATGV